MCKSNREVNNPPGAIEPTAALPAPCWHVGMLAIWACSTFLLWGHLVLLRGIEQQHAYRSLAQVLWTIIGFNPQDTKLSAGLLFESSLWVRSTGLRWCCKTRSFNSRFIHVNYVLQSKSRPIFWLPRHNCHICFQTCLIIFQWRPYRLVNVWFSGYVHHQVAV